MSRSYPRSLPSYVKRMVQADTYHDDTLMLLGYARNVMHAVEAASREAGILVTWLSRNRERFGMPDSLFTEIDREGRRRRPKRCLLTRHLGKLLRKLSTPRCMKPREEARHRGGSIAAGLSTVSAALGFDPLDAACFEIIFLYCADSVFERLFDDLAAARGRLGLLRRYPEMFALFTGAARAEVTLRFRMDSQLLVSGSISIDQEGW